MKIDIQNDYNWMLLVDGDHHGYGYVTPIVYCLEIMQMIVELANQSL